MPGNKRFLIAATLAALLAGSAEAADRHEQHHHDFAQDVDAFHAVLAPLWHARPGQERTRNVCAQTTQLASRAAEIRSGDAKTLVASVAALQQRCQTQPADIDAAFFDVHQAFHHVAERRGR